MICLEELNPHKYPTTPEIDSNLSELLCRLNRARIAYGAPFTVTSGLRSTNQQSQLIAEGKSNAPHSKHLTGQAADILDEEGELAEWVQANMDFMEEIGFWFEDFTHTDGWVHFQITAPNSGKRVFIP